MWYIHTMECYSAIMKNKQLITGNNLNGNTGNYAAWKEPVSKASILGIAFT